MANINFLLNIDIAEVLENINMEVNDLVTLDDFRNYIANNTSYSAEELEYIYALIEGILISSNASKETVEPKEESTLTSKDQNIEKNRWLILYIMVAGILLGIIVIYFNRKKNSENNKNN